MIKLSNVSLAYGSRDVLKDINFTLNPAQKIALTGANGSGKSTLMKIMSGLLRPDSGEVSVSAKSRVSYLPQTGALQHGLTLYEETEKAFTFWRQLLAKKHTLEHQITEIKQESPQLKRLLDRQHEYEELLAESGYYLREKQIDKVLKGLGFSEHDYGKDCGHFSGGWQMRIALAKTLLENPDIMLLDEPTNYLDINAIEWLEDYLKNYRGSLLIVSHDRHFLDTTVEAVAEVFMGRVNIYKGNYTTYEKRRTQELATLVEQYKKQQEEIEKNEAFIRRFRAQATKASQVQSRVKMLDKLELIELPPGIKKIHFSFPPAPESGKITLKAAGLLKSYNGKKVFDGLDLELPRGEKLAITGVNGAGKSTLMRLLAGRENADEGTITYGKNINLGYFSQENLEAMDTRRSIYDELEAHCPTALVPALRSILGGFLFPGDDAFKKINVLSGGEKSRVSLIKLLLTPHNLLCLDEPTNHLDMTSKDILLDALSNFAGTIIFVSHDHYFLQALATRVLEIKEQRCKLYLGDYDYYLWKKQHREAAPEAKTIAASGETVKTQSQLSREREKELKSQLRRCEKQEESIMISLERLDGEIKAVQEQMTQPEVYAQGDKIKQCRHKLSNLQDDHDRLLSEWQNLEAELKATKEQLV